MADNKDLPAEELAKKMQEVGLKAAKCTMRCMMCKNWKAEGASNLVLGAAAVATAFALI